MEAIEQVGKQPDSFEEVDRILTVVEASKKDLDKVNAEKSSRMVVALYIPLVLSVIGVSFSVYGLIVHKQTLSDQLFFVVPFVVFLFIEIRNAFIYDKIISEKKKAYELTNSKATELLREIIPVVSRKENWSEFKKIEIKLRLSKLAISPGGILGENRL